MRNRIISILVLAFAMVSCGDLGEMSNDYKDGIVITLKGAGAVTKADTDPNPGAGDDTLNENKVESLCYFIYDADGALLHSGSQSFSPALTVNEPTKVRLIVSETDFDRIFTTESTVSMYIVANVDADNFTNLSAKNDIKAVEVAIQNGGAKQDNFVMSGEGEVSKNTDGSVFKATGSVDLTRSLAKITLNLNIRSFYAEKNGAEVVPGAGGSEETIEFPMDPEEELTEYDQFWVPLYNGLTVTFHNGAADGTVGGAPLASPDFFELELDENYDTDQPENDPVNYVDTFEGKQPFYTYARTWEKHQISGAAGDTQPYFLIMLPWQKYGVETPTYQPTYYKIVLNGSEFVANSWYNITVSLNGLGSLTKGEPVEVTPLTFEVGSWRESIVDDTSEVEYNTVSEVQSDEVRVLSFNQKDFTLNNRNSITIPFTTTHDCVISKIELAYVEFDDTEVIVHDDYYKTGTSSSISIDNPDPEHFPSKTATATISNGYLTFTHEMVNDFTQGTFDYQSYVYTITVEHFDNDSFNEKIVITQNPALNITSATQNKSTVYVNNNSSGKSDWTTVWGKVNSSGNNSCPYVYTITVSQLSDDTNSVGDPRVSTPSTASELGISNPSAQNATAYDNTTRTLTYYYGADETKTDVIAPKYSICSAYGALYNGNNGRTVTAATAKYRCATYQELGKPAGRWRLPTEAELNFIGKLCAKGLIPSIFFNNQDYFAASGAFRYSSSNNSFEKRDNVTNGYVRCVYDDWYWENSSYPTCPTNQFTWGDMPM